MEAADQILLAAPYVPGAAPVIPVPAPTSNANACVVYGALETPDNQPAFARTLQFRPVSPGVVVGGRLVTRDPVAVETGPNGAFAATLLSGVTYAVTCADLFTGARRITTVGATMDVTQSLQTATC